MLTPSRDTRFVAAELALHHATSQTDIKGLTEATQDLENYLRAKEIYSKARWIDETGQERIRIESNKHGITTLSPTKTENKSDRYSFREAMRIGKDKSICPRSIWKSNTTSSSNRITRFYEPPQRCSAHLESLAVSLYSAMRRRICPAHRNRLGL